MAAVDVVVWHLAGRRRALRLCGRRLPRGAPFLHEARDGERPTELFRERPQEDGVAPRRRRLSGNGEAVQRRLGALYRP